MKRLLIVAALFLCACEPPMTNETIIKESKKCTDAGLGVKTYTSDMGIYLIQCDPTATKPTKKEPIKNVRK
jgi:hypothetical protein